MKYLLMGSTRMYFAPDDGTGGGGGGTGTGDGTGTGTGTGRADSPFADPPADKTNTDQQQQQEKKPDNTTQQQQKETEPNSWFKALSAEDQAYAKNKGWDKAEDAPGAMFKGYKNLETMMGADKAGRTMLAPKDANDTEALNAIYDRLGRPKEASEYKIEVPEGTDPALANTFKTAFHKSGLSTKQAETLTQVYKAAELDNMAKIKEVHADQVEALQKELGTGWDKFVETGRAGIKAAGLDKADVKRAENAMGPQKFAKMMALLGKHHMEADPPPNDTRDGGGNLNLNKMTATQAQEKITALRADKEFMSRYDSNDPKIREQAMNELNGYYKIVSGGK